MITKDPEINNLIKQQHELYRELEKTPHNKELENTLVEVTEKITNKTKELVSTIESKIETAVVEVEDIIKTKPKSIKKQLKLKYKELVVLYRVSCSTSKYLVGLKRIVRNKIKTL